VNFNNNLHSEEPRVSSSSIDKCIGLCNADSISDITIEGEINKNTWKEKYLKCSRRRVEKCSRHIPITSRDTSVDRIQNSVSSAHSTLNSVSESVHSVQLNYIFRCSANNTLHLNTMFAMWRSLIN